MIINRIVYIIFTALAGVCVILYDSPAAFVILYSFILLPGATFALAMFSRRFLTVEQSFDKNYIYKNETAEFCVKLYNRGAFYFSRVKLYFEDEYSGAMSVSSLDGSSGSVSLAPGAALIKRFSLKCSYRGEYEMGLKKLEIYDALGLFMFPVEFGERAKLTVYPSMREISDFPFRNINITDASSSPDVKDEDYTSIADIRKYEPTDSFKKIHWKLSAKKNELMTKNFQANVMNASLLFVDAGRSSEDALTALRLEDALAEEVISVIDYCFKKSYPADMIYLKNGCLQKLGTRAGFPELYYEVAKLRFDEEGGFCGLIDEQVSRVKDPTNIVVFTCSLGGDLYELLRYVKALGHNVILVYYCDGDTEEAYGYRTALLESGIPSYFKEFSA